MGSSSRMMVRDDIARAVEAAVRAAQAAGDVPPVALPDVTVERPQRAEYGDYATSLPLRLARAAGMRPLDIAEAVRRHLPALDAVAEATVAPPGFVNFRLRPEWLAAQVEEIRRAGEAFADLDLGGGRTVQVEFVSANPTGPVHVGNGRGAVFGSTLANVLAAAGYRVEREYYVNDAGTQIDAFARTLYARYQQLCGRDAPLPEDGYPGEYMVDLAQEIRERHGDAFLRPEGEPPPPELADLGIQGMLARIRADLEALGVRYDVWFSERDLYRPGGLYEQTMALLRERGYVVEKEGAVWFTSSGLGDDRDNVLVRSSGEPTYFASDVAYHYDKFVVRGFDRVIDIWGADHQGHVGRVKAAVAALGVDPDRLDILLYQLVTLRRGKEVVRLSKRGGDIITLREVVDEVGADACRFFFLARSHDSQMDFDLELAKRQSNENPVYYVQYAHARIAGILNHAAERNIDYADGDVSLLRHPAELALIRKMLQLPELIEAVARALEPHHLPHYATDLATEFHQFYTECRVVSDDLALTKARLKLVEAARLTLARTLHLMGMTAPERM
ncbi:MAG TPA: arginine--tRNA ligase [Dehalococcoidia bacterium]